MKYLNGRILFALLFVVVFASLIVTATTYSQKAKTMPLLVSIPAFLGAVGNLILEVRVVQRGEKPAKEESELPAHTAAPVVQEKVAGSAPVLEMATAGGALPPMTSGTAPVQVGTLPVESGKPKKKKEKLSDSEKRKRELTGIAWLFAYVAAIILLGFPLATIGYMVAFIRLYNHESWRLTIVYTIVLWAFIWVAFVYFLKSTLYPGLIFSWLEG